MTRPTSVDHTRAACRAALARRREIRRTIARTLRQALQEHRAGVIASLRHVLPVSRPAAADLDARVLRAIENHPEGVCALDIGNEMGIDWRRVLESTRTLVEQGLIEQVEREFYPSRKARRRW